MITRRLALTATLATPFLARPALSQAATLNVNSALTADDPLFKGLEAFKQGVETRSNGRLQVRLYPSSQLGSDEDVLEQARAGAGVAVVVDGGRLAPFVREFGILGAPYIANGFPELRKLATSPLFDRWADRLRTASGHQVLSFNWFQGDRHLLTNRAIAAPADLNGLRLRTPGAPVWLETIRAMGATPTPLPWTEVYSALQLRAIDAAEAQYPALWGSRLYEVVRFITKTSHINLITGLIGSRIWFDRQPAELRTILREEALKGGDTGSQATLASLDDFETRLKAQGLTITTPDLAPFREATKVVYDKLNYAAVRREVEAVLAG
ncbi:C4-dicarboxylate TRAP transporter substrate-binding protein [Falsiroseomonas tokyonensis]|uniref:C4-dicarboxylate TRAP transporter substrate-binding protein n=1 Tax=Falsiroseomonas tokyonensis TaxID=430521 RepID=A0ABV7BZ12_9PROT|nr:C4-dicarboxylate TRAP transporter substrate-binding protein [Falsiroseomonas tokyonensis]MBU8539153.1 C4-dicarboxylate TRAP transporter substrate-binding protein [Falsiroseomonas tokyonensis]